MGPLEKHMWNAVERGGRRAFLEYRRHAVAVLNTALSQWVSTGSDNAQSEQVTVIGTTVPVIVGVFLCETDELPVHVLPLELKLLL